MDERERDGRVGRVIERTLALDDDPVAEALALGRECGVAVEVSHNAPKWGAREDAGANLALIEQMAIEHDYQCWIEMVADSPNGPGVYIEDGTVSS